MSLLRRLAMVTLAAGLGVSLAFMPMARAQDAADELALPGLQSDAESFVAKLRAPYPAGLPDAKLKAAAATAKAALAAKDYTKALPALQMLIGGLGQNSTPDNAIKIGVRQSF